jgi:hypothetical protein
MVCCSTYSKLSEYVLTAVDTYAQTGHSTSSSWSREAIFALVTIFIMLLLSSLGLISKRRWLLWSWAGRSRWLLQAPEGMRYKLRLLCEGWTKATHRCRAGLFELRLDLFRLGRHRNCQTTTTGSIYEDDAENTRPKPGTKRNEIVCLMIKTRLRKVLWDEIVTGVFTKAS